MTKTCAGILKATASVFLFCILGAPATASAATVRQIDFSELVARSELVFHGRVVAVGTRWDEDTQSVMTDVEFAVVEAILGTDPGRRLQLSFPAGRHGAIEVVVHGLQIPKRDEQGIYFIESASRPMVNPIYGWTQGQFLVGDRDATGKRRVFTSDGSPVYAVESTATSDRISISRGTARGVRTTSDGPTKAALTVDEFRKVILRTAETVR